MKYKVEVNGVSYDVNVTPVDGGEPVVSSVKKSEERVAYSGKGKTIQAPLQGKVSEIRVHVGDSVSEGQVVVVIEAMKMENDIASTCTGKIADILVKEGDMVDSGTDLLVVA